MVSSGHPRPALLYRQAASLRACSTCGVGGPFWRTGSLCLLCGSAVGWGMRDRRVSDGNDPLASGQSVGFLRGAAGFLLHFVLLEVHLPVRLITSPSYFLLSIYVLLAPLNFSPTA